MIFNKLTNIVVLAKGFKLIYSNIYSPIAQLVERRIVNPLVGGSSPSWGANHGVPSIVENIPGYEPGDGSSILSGRTKQESIYEFRFLDPKLSTLPLGQKINS